MKSFNVIESYKNINKYKKENYYDINSLGDDFFINTVILAALYGENKDYSSFGEDIRKLYLSFINNKIGNIYYTDVNKNSNMKEYYKKNMKLLRLPRKGHMYWGIDKTCDFVSDHIFSCICLSNIIYDEYKLDIDINKVNAMIAVHELEEIIKGDETVFDKTITNNKEYGTKCSDCICNILKYGYRIKELVNEFNNRETKESKYAYMCDKLEYLMQVKVNEENNLYDFNNRKENVVTTSKDIIDIINNGASSVFEVHYEYDRSKFANDKVFSEIYYSLNDKEINKILK